ncbi:hypothetical protein Bca101_085144 [Brassica carinata]
MKFDLMDKMLCFLIYFFFFFSFLSYLFTSIDLLFFISFVSLSLISSPDLLISSSILSPLRSPSRPYAPVV